MIKNDVITFEHLYDLSEVDIFKLKEIFEHLIYNKMLYNMSCTCVIILCYINIITCILTLINIGYIVQLIINMNMNGEKQIL
jgi:hypothetical protein